MFFKRRSSRANSYVEHDAPPRSQSFDEYAEKRPDSSRKETHQQQQPDTPTDEVDNNMYARQQQPQETASLPTRGMPNGGHSAMPPQMNQRSTGQPEPMPDLLAQAFNQAIRPYTEKIEQLEHQLADMQAWVDQLEQQRAEVHSWIDKRGLRPDVPPSIAKIMDTTTPDAAIALNAQLDRKITIVNFDLHRLQDDLNDSISSSHFASAMLKFLPDIQRLALLPQGPRHAFDLVLKLGGNLNSHGAIDSADPADIAARRDFYQRLDTAMVDVVTRRFGEGEDWNVQREIKRIEKTASYLKTYGVEPYFPETLEMMKRELEFQPQQHNGAPANGQGTPPRWTAPLSKQLDGSKDDSKITQWIDGTTKATKAQESNSPFSRYAEESARRNRFSRLGRSNSAKQATRALMDATTGQPPRPVMVDQASGLRPFEQPKEEPQASMSLSTPAELPGSVLLDPISIQRTFDRARANLQASLAAGSRPKARSETTLPQAGSNALLNPFINESEAGPSSRCHDKRPKSQG